MSTIKEIFVQTDKCLGCSSCKLACAVEHSKAGDIYGAVHELPRPRARIFIEWLEENVKVPVLCRHCEDAPCINACICGAIGRNEFGAAVTDEDKCIGCWTCVMVCPYGVIGRDKDRGTAYRCDRCPNLDIPACVSSCPTGALVYAAAESFSADKRKEAAWGVASGEGA